MGKAKHFIQVKTLGKKNFQKIQPLTLLYTIFHEKDTPFIYLLSVTNGTPSKYLV